MHRDLADAGDARRLPPVTIVAEPNSWVVPYAERFATLHDAAVVPSYDAIQDGGIAIFFGCTRVVPAEILARSEHNLVAHQSNLPRGRGWSPLAWQVIEGAAEIPVALFEAVGELDAGPVYFRDVIRIEGHELVDELRELQATSTVALYERFLAGYPDVPAEPQAGTPTFYPRRTRADSRLDPEESIAAQFDLLRICDNERYPAFFDHRGHRFELRISKVDPPPDA